VLVLDAVVQVLCLAGWAIPAVRPGLDQPSASAAFS
jgi:hypothetical protein